MGVGGANSLCFLCCFVCCFVCWQVAPLELRGAVVVDNSSPVGTVVNIDWTHQQATVVVHGHSTTTGRGRNGGRNGGGGGGRSERRCLIPLSHLVPVEEHVLHPMMGVSRIVTPLVQMCKLTLDPSLGEEEQEEEEEGNQVWCWWCCWWCCWWWCWW